MKSCTSYFIFVLNLICFTIAITATLFDEWIAIVPKSATEFKHVENDVATGFKGHFTMYFLAASSSMAFISLLVDLIHIWKNIKILVLVSSVCSTVTNMTTYIIIYQYDPWFDEDCEKVYSTSFYLFTTNVAFLLVLFLIKIFQYIFEKRLKGNIVFSESHISNLDIGNMYDYT